jgi:nitronate monooxygenase
MPARDPAADPRTALCDLLGVRHPLVLAPMAGGPSTAELAAAVSRAGGLGTIGASGMAPQALADAVRRARELAAGAPIGVNVLLAPPTPPDADDEEVQRFLGAVRADLGLPHPPPAPPARPGTPDQLLRAGVEAGARVLSVAMGDPAPAAALAREAGVPLLAAATSVAEAEEAAAAGADVVVAQGAEAGGHRASLAGDAGEPFPMVGTFALVPQVIRAVDVPVVAAGAVMDGRGLAAALCLGAAGVQMGTRFLGSREAGVPEGYRERLRRARDTDTMLITAASGRPARGLRNRIIERLETEGPGGLGWPRQAGSWGDIRAAGTRADDPDLITLWAGQAAAMIDPEPRGAEEIVAEVIREAAATLGRLGAGAPALRGS